MRAEGTRGTASGAATRGAPRRRRAWRPRRGAALLVSAGLLLTGCASMPGSGPVQQADSAELSEGESQVRVFGVPPEDDAPPQDIVRGFLEAVTSDEADFETAKRYLTPERRGDWDPFHGTMVLSSGPNFEQSVSEPGLEGGGETFRVEISGTQLAAVDSSRVYAPQNGMPYEASFELRLVDGQWRIDDLPAGLVMAEADFRRIYRPVDAYYFADLGPETSRVTRGDDVLVADPIYVRRWIDPISELVDTLLDGPSGWLDPVVNTAFPEGVTMAQGEEPEIDESGHLSVRLAGVPRDDWSTAQCERMGAQLLHSVEVLASVELVEARLANEAGTLLCELTRTQAGAYAPGLLDGETEQPYFLDGDQHLVTVEPQDDAEPVALSGPLSRDEVALRSAAVSRNEDWAAGVSADGSSLYVAPLFGGDALSEPVYQRELTGPDDPGLTAPSWDGLGDLWFADRDPVEGQQLLLLRSGSGEPQEIPVTGLRPDQQIEALRVASDGVRIAMLVTEGEQTTLQLGRIERSGAGDDRVVTVDDLRRLAPQLENVAAASWAGGSQLMVVGRPADGVEGWQSVATDGSLAITPTMPGLNDVTGIADAEDERKPLLAETADGIARLGDDSQWKLVSEDGTGPFYPG
ncbi:LpqB family beta-propeller domain-containing protein [Streptomyces sp. B6B3]|uniref:LpqB family beta-propeller domain-containing protein n=1 Tax=Streptomyces sp. B6B3 TaxID=3153570 RepID=UPI00325E963C